MMSARYIAKEVIAVEVYPIYVRRTQAEAPAHLEISSLHVPAWLPWRIGRNLNGTRSDLRKSCDLIFLLGAGEDVI